MKEGLGSFLLPPKTIDFLGSHNVKYGSEANIYLSPYNRNGTIKYIFASNRTVFSLK